MRIVFIENEDLSRDSSGGVMSYIINISDFLLSKNIETELIGSGEVKKNGKSDKVLMFQSISVNSSISNLKFFFKLFFTKKLKGIKKGDIVHVQRPEMVIPLALRTKNKIVCTLHGGQDLAVYRKKGRIYGFFYFLLQILSFILVDHLIVVDKKNKKRYINKYPWIKNKISLISIAIDVRKFFPRDKDLMKKKFNIPIGEKVLLFIGRLEYEKNIEFLIKSFSKVPKKLNYKLIIVGSGSKELELKNLVFKLKSNIEFFGEIDNNLIPEIINCADALVLTSKFEGSPTVVKEAICCNVPVISTDVGDVKEVLSNNNAGIIIEDNTESFVKAIENIGSIYNLNIDNLRAKYGHNVMGELTMNIYKKLN